jgi:hypothetical protein
MRVSTCAGDAGNAGPRQRWLVVDGIELLLAFYFVENCSEWINLYEILWEHIYFDAVLKHASFNLHSFLSLGMKLSRIFCAC